jgi:putative ABC transport system permease protein
MPLQLQARIAGDLESFAGSLRAAVREVDADLGVDGIVSLEDSLWDWIWPARFGAMFHSSLALVGITLAILGIYGVIAHSVGRRTREIGVRMALGADQHEAVGLIVREGLWLSAMGTLLGCAGIVALSGTLRATFFGLRSIDPLLAAASAALFFVVAALSTYFPARRAARVDPVRALRAE